MSEYLAALVDGEHLDWAMLERRFGPGSVELARLRRLAEIIATFAAGSRGAQAQPEPAGVAWGHLRVFESIGKGSYGEVHRAFDPLLEREVALKLRHQGPALQARAFIAEARRLARVRHENVLAVHGAAIHDGRAGLWSDLIAGQSLADWVREAGPRPVAEILPIAGALAAALDAVHAAGLVHGDVKPGNIMREDGSGRIVLMDFGSAGDRADAERHGLVGSPASMAPEQMRGDPVGPSADMYSFGVVLHHLATGAYPGRASPARGGAATQVPGALRGLLGDLLAHDPAARPDAAQVGRRLRSIVDAPRRRRRRAAVGTVIASLVLGLAASVYALVRVEAERAEAVAAREREAAVNGFLSDMLSAPSPSGEGAEVRVVDVLEAAVFDSRQRFADQPRLRLSILRTVGDSYRDLELWEPARAVLVDALALSREVNGPDSEASLDVEAILRHVEAHVGSYDAARDALSDLFERTRRHLGDGHKITVDTALVLSDLLRNHSDTEAERRRLLEFVLAQRNADTTGSVELEQRVTALIYLLSMRGLYGPDERSGALLDEASRAVKRLPADWTAVRAMLRTSVAVALAQHGNLIEAEAEFRRLLEAAERRYGPAHRNLRARLNNLGYTLVLQHRHDEAIPILERAVELGERYGGPADPGLRQALDSLADALAGAGRLDEAGTIRERLYADAVRDSGADHPFTLMVALGLAEQYVHVGRGAAAVSLATETAERAARVLRPDHPYALEARELAARARFATGERDAVLAGFADLCASKAQALGSDDSRTASCHAHHAQLLAEAGDRSGASRLLGEAIERNARRYGADHPSTRALQAHLATLAGDAD